MSQVMKVINIFFDNCFYLLFYVSCRNSRMQKKQSDISRILSILNEINSMNIDNIYTDKNNFIEDLTEANKYRDAVNEPKRLWYRWYEDYLSHHER